MKPFNLEEYLKNPSRKLVTKEGKTVKRILCTDARGSYPVVALIEESYYDNALSYTEDGKLYNGESNLYDLFFAPEKHEKWINIYRDMPGLSPGAKLYDSREEAENVAKSYPHYVATAKVEWEE